MVAPARDCQLDVTFHSTPDGRPEIYDFMWEHASSLFAKLDQKKVRATLSLSLPAKKKDAHFSLLAFLQKLSMDRRFKLSQKTTNKPTALDMDSIVNTAQLDVLLNNYNVLFEAGMATTTLESPLMTIDFSPAAQNKVRIFTTRAHAPKVKAFLSTSFSRAPKIQTISYTLNHPFQAALSRGRV